MLFLKGLISLIRIPNKHDLISLFKEKANRPEVKPLRGSSKPSTSQTVMERESSGA